MLVVRPKEVEQSVTWRKLVLDEAAELYRMLLPGQYIELMLRTQINN